MKRTIRHRAVASRQFEGKQSDHREPLPCRAKPLALAISLTCAAAASNAGSAPVGSPEEIEEITVTATRRAQSVQDIPYNISAVGGDVLDDAGITDISELTRFVPGLAYSEIGARNAGVNNQIIMRGLNVDTVGLGGTAPTIAPSPVSTYIGETPIFADIKLADLDRVEVLRGPQGTIYGANSLGGTVRFMPNLPTMNGREASLRATTGLTEDSDDVNYSFDGIFNQPISDNVAIRIAAGYEKQAGVIDMTAVPVFTPPDNPAGFGVPALADPANPETSPYLVDKEHEDVDDAENWYVRATLLWDATENAQVVLRYYHQDDQFGGQTAEVFGGTAERVNTRPTIETMHRKIDVFSADVTVDLGFASLTSATSYWNNKYHSTDDITGLIQILNFYYGGYPRITAPLDTPAELEAVTEEIRLVSQSDGPWDWLIGAFYQDNSHADGTTQYIPGYKAWSELPHPIAEYYLGAGASWADLLELFGSGRPSSKPNAFFVDRKIDVEDIAIFGELGYQITKAWHVSFGARVFWDDYSQDLLTQSTYCGALCAADGLDPLGSATSLVKKNLQVQIFKFNTSFNINDNTMTYFTWSEGFRRGGANGFPLTGPLSESASLIPFDADTVTNYEVGVKGSFLDQRVQYSLAGYYLDWTDPQINTLSLPGGFPIVINADGARSIGMELEATAQLTDRLSMSFGYSYTDSELTADFSLEDVTGFDGDKLPGVPKHQASWSISYTYPFTQGSELIFGLDGFVRDDATTALNAANPNFTQVDGFSIWNASITWHYQNWRLGLFGKNLADESGISAVRTLSESPSTALEYITRPRTFGLLAEYRY